VNETVCDANSFNCLGREIERTSFHADARLVEGRGRTEHRKSDLISELRLTIFDKVIRNDLKRANQASKGCVGKARWRIPVFGSTPGASKHFQPFR
jgi:hypothetical protein